MDAVYISGRHRRLCGCRTLIKLLPSRDRGIRGAAQTPAGLIWGQAERGKHSWERGLYGIRPICRCLDNPPTRWASGLVPRRITPGISHRVNIPGVVRRTTSPFLIFSLVVSLRQLDRSLGLDPDFFSNLCWSTVIKCVTPRYHERLSPIISLPRSTTHEGKSGIDLLYMHPGHGASFSQCGPGPSVVGLANLATMEVVFGVVIAIGAAKHGGNAYPLASEVLFSPNAHSICYDCVCITQ